MTPFAHLVATTRGRDRSLLRPERACWLWARLRGGLPNALSCVFMADHIHLVAAASDRSRLRHILSAFTVRFGVRFDILDPEPANSPAIAGRMMRYGFFNPVRARLVDDPFAWPWSTLRDLVGASEPTWTPLPRIASSLRLSPDEALRGLTTLGGIPYAPPLPRPILSASIEDVRAAVRSVLRLPSTAPHVSATERRLAVATSFHVGTPRVTDLATALGCSPRTIHRDRSTPHPALGAVLLSLGDPRLLLGPVDTEYRARRSHRRACS